MNIFDAIAKLGVNMREKSKLEAYSHHKLTKNGKAVPVFVRIASSPDANVDGFDEQSLRDYFSSETTKLPTINKKSASENGVVRATNGLDFNAKEDALRVAVFLSCGTDTQEEDAGEETEREETLKTAQS